MKWLLRLMGEWFTDSDFIAFIDSAASILVASVAVWVIADSRLRWLLPDVPHTLTNVYWAIILGVWMLVSGALNAMLPSFIRPLYWRYQVEKSRQEREAGTKPTLWPSVLLNFDEPDEYGEPVGVGLHDGIRVRCPYPRPIDMEFEKKLVPCGAMVCALVGYLWTRDILLAGVFLLPGMLAAFAIHRLRFFMRETVFMIDAEGITYRRGWLSGAQYRSYDGQVTFSAEKHHLAGAEARAHAKRLRWSQSRFTPQEIYQISSQVSMATGPGFSNRSVLAEIENDEHGLHASRLRAVLEAAVKAARDHMTQQAAQQDEDNRL